ncbi:MAG: TMEM165/GDT1 family protein [Elusimicrobia bacterium]|nr:TMEM165/GDT1 family protein [Elusimicrobiota bacterium]
MDKSVFWSTFVTLFLAEFGDKTQLATITLTGSTGRPWAVFFGAAAGLAAVTGVGVLFGEGIARLVPPLILRRSAAALFVVMGVWLWLRPQ